jgi:Na+-translocating ferredoxin:NAD+ oxidoreductase RNF subunit RnfB
MSWFRATEPRAGASKILPVIDRGLCTGCGLCLAACEQGCLAFCWSLAELKHPECCTGEGRCVEACPQELIEMKRVPAP